MERIRTLDGVFASKPRADHDQIHIARPMHVASCAGAEQDHSLNPMAHSNPSPERLEFPYEGTWRRCGISKPIFEIRLGNAQVAAGTPEPFGRAGGLASASRHFSIRTFRHYL